MTGQVVVGAAVVLGGRVLAARRSAPARLAGWWEFPGGKVEVGESDTEALVRECREELGIEVRVTGLLASSPVRAGVLLRVYRACLLDGEPRPLQDHDLLRWVGREQLAQLRWLPADRPAVDALAAVVH